PEGPGSESVRVVGHQWWWEFEYPEYGFTTANELVIPVSSEDNKRTIALQLESADVIHSFWVPRLAGKTDTVPGNTNHMWLRGDHEATYFGRCAEYCGTQHTKMLFRVDVVSERDYQHWVANQEKPAVDDPAFQAGRERFMEMSCANCHTIRGTRAKGTFGPDLTHLMSRKTLGSAIVENNHATLKAWLHDPNAFKASCYMPNFRLNDDDLQLITDYLASLE
ncbi:MAG: c-type cytochrome, partial [Planctomycetaceae bacterium]